MTSMWSNARYRTFQRSEGFTLLEVMIAVAILAAALLTLLHTQNANISLVEESERVTAATLLAQGHITELAMGDTPELGEETGSFADEENGADSSLYRWTHRVSEAGRERLRRVEVTVSWEPDGPSHSVTLVTYMLERGQVPELE